MFITRIELKNFQSHVHSIIDLDKNSTCIIGRTNSGKSSIERALAFLFYNDWDPDFLTIGASLCEVRVWLDSGVSVHRLKSAKINKYIIYNTDGTIKEYSNFGTEVPKDILTILGVSEVEIDGKFIRFNNHSQDDSYFILSETSSFKNKLFSLISGIVDINRIIKSLNADKKIYKTEIDTFTNLIKNKQFELLNIENKLKLYSGFEDQKNKVETLIEKYNTFIVLQEYRQKLNNIKKFIDDFNLKFKFDIYNTLNIKFNFLEKIVNYNLQLSKINDNLNMLNIEMNNLKSKISLYNSELKSLVSKCDKLNKSECPLLMLTISN